MYCLHKGFSVHTKYLTHFLHNGNKNSITYTFELRCIAVFKSTNTCLSLARACLDITHTP